MDPNLRWWLMVNGISIKNIYNIVFFWCRRSTVVQAQWYLILIQRNKIINIFIFAFETLWKRDKARRWRRWQNISVLYFPQNSGCIAYCVVKLNAAFHNIWKKIIYYLKRFNLNSIINYAFKLRENSYDYYNLSDLWCVEWV